MTPPEDAERPEHLEVLLETEWGLQIERIVSRGHESPAGFWYDQPRAEWVTVVSGAARLEFREPDEVLEMKPGDHVLIAAHRPHRVQWTSPDEPTTWLAVFFPERGEG